MRAVSGWSSFCGMALLSAIAVPLAAPAFAADALPRLKILPGSLTVSGVSAGGYMATQYQVAFSKDVIGAGIIGAGPWHCAQGSAVRALDDCMKGGAIGPEIGPLVAALRASAAADAVDDPSWLAPDRIWMLHGARDTTVGAAVMDSLLRFYRAFVPPERIYYETQVRVSHGFPTDGEGGSCDQAQSPWIYDCGYDAAGRMFQHLYDGLREPAGDVQGVLRVFDQKRYATGGMLGSLADSGFLFVPADCASGRPCRIHVAFHGCRQGSGYIGKGFARTAGYNRWADANRIVLLYPQVAASNFWPFNPRGCWDWWGYSGANYASRSGAQLASVRRMLVALGAAF